MNEERKTNNKEFHCSVMEQKHIVCWEGEQVRLILAPWLDNGEETAQSFQLIIETREVSIMEDSYGYGEWQPAIRHKSTDIHFLYELKKAASDLLSLNEQSIKEETSDDGQHRYRIDYDRNPVRNSFSVARTDRVFENGSSLESYSLVFGLRLLLMENVSGAISDRVRIEINQITRYDLSRLITSLSIFLAHKEELILIQNAYLEETVLSSSPGESGFFFER